MSRELARQGIVCSTSEHGRRPARGQGHVAGQREVLLYGLACTALWLFAFGAVVLGHWTMRDMR